MRQGNGLCWWEGGLKNYQAADSGRATGRLTNIPGKLEWQVQPKYQSDGVGDRKKMPEFLESKGRWDLQVGRE